ncbi:hypothetical protein AAC387_Pa05g2796 [Persea americana]
MARINHEKIILILVATCLVLIGGAKGGGRTITDLKIRRQLKRLNKPAVKSIKGGDGNIIDCVDIYKQPAFDRLLLKNHTIQMKPSNYNIEKKTSSKPIDQLWQKSGSCPEGTIPIARTRKSDLLRKISLEDSAPAIVENAKLYVGEKNYGGEAKITVWNIHVEPAESSTASILVGVKGQRDLINAGWMVSPHVFGDNKTHLYVYWASDNGGCYNLLCPGFVQTNSHIQLGSLISPLSVYGGQQYFIKVKLHKDKENDHWWFDYQDQPVGYWPGSLFRNMATIANLIEWGWQVWNTKPGGRHTNTEMGSSHFPKEHYGKAAFFDECLYESAFYKTEAPTIFPIKATSPSCYDIAELRPDYKKQGANFLFGGPGGVGCDEK